MHSWKLEPLGDHGWYCTTAAFEERYGSRDNPEPERHDAEMATIIRNTEWTVVKHPMLTNLVEMIANAKKEIAEGIESSVLSDLPRNPVGFSDLLRTTVRGYEDAIRLEDERWRNSPFYKIMQERQAEIRLLYGTMTNYFLVMDHKPQQEGAASPRTTNQQPTTGKKSSHGT